MERSIRRCGATKGKEEDEEKKKGESPNQNYLITAYMMQGVGVIPIPAHQNDSVYPRIQENVYEINEVLYRASEIKT